MRPQRVAVEGTPCWEERERKKGRIPRLHRLNPPFSSLPPHQLPPSLAAHWRQACAAAASAGPDGDGPVLGRLAPPAASGAASSLTLEGAGIPPSGATAYTARSAPPGAARVLAVGGGVAPIVAGRVDGRLDIASASAPRGAAATATARRPVAPPSRTLQMIDDPRAGVLRRLPVAAAGVAKKPPPRRPRRGEFEKRARATKDEVEAALFRCFETKAAWTFGELHAATDQPAPWLREVLGGVAAPVKRPGVKDVWELKPDYRVGGGGGAGPS